MTSTTRKRNIIASIVGVGIAGLVTVGLTVPSGASFNDQKPAHINISTATLSLGVSDDDNSGTIDMSFSNLKPGQAVTHTFTVRNDGTVAATAKFGPGVNALTVTGGNQSLMNQNDLRVGLWETSGGQVNGLVPINQQPVDGWDLGVLNPGQSKTFTVMVKLGGAAGNEWQGVVINGDVPVTLTQQ